MHTNHRRPNKQREAKRLCAEKCGTCNICVGIMPRMRTHRRNEKQRSIKESLELY